MANVSNLDLDVMDAERMGYGVHYGRFKADHPHTAEKNELRLASLRRGGRIRQVQTKVCIQCGREFQTENKQRLYCGDDCKKVRDSERYLRHKARKAQKAGDGDDN